MSADVTPDVVPKCCPHCQSAEIIETVQWAAMSEVGQTIETLIEWQCRNEAGNCCKSFWV